MYIVLKKQAIYFVLPIIDLKNQEECVLPVTSFE